MLKPIRLTAAFLIALMTASPALAVNKDMVQLQTQVQQLLDAVARLQQSNDERMGVLKDLVQQSADSVNRLSVNMDALQKQLAAQSTTQATRSDQVSTQVQALNDSLDEIRARMMRLEKVMNDVQNQQQSMSASLQPGAIQPGAIQPGSTQPAPSQPGTPASGTYIPGPSAIAPDAGSPRAAAPANAIPVTDLYRTAYSDYMAAKYPVASSEFQDIIKSYPDDTFAGNAFYYLGEIDYRAGKFANAAHDYDKVLEQFPDNNKIPAAHLHKGQALIELKQQEAGIRELRTLIQRFPSSPEATQARAKLNALGVPAKPRP